ncbi:hypothetical protein MTR67_034677 [Solanum verrucosum]|uniref:Major facilitator superfamily (MFS) profile domain-containing protein n=1 Tax=Solanum verrucosum TaxID=315347 RepID=A0AAF0U8L1_SOLVR|nr:hypothetical protein MTR67_034677 [Solanum verrucosum]
MAVAGAIIGAAIGGWLNDKFGRKSAILIADFLFFVGAVIMASAMNSALLIVGRVFVGLGVGMASMTAPLYISEASPAKIRGALAPGTWRWMLGVAGLPALLQFILMLLLPESPRWLYRKGRQEETKTILRKIYSAEQVEVEIQALKELVDKEIEENKVSENINLFKLYKTKTVRRGLIAGVGLQIFQQFVGINTVMYYSPTIIQLAGIASNRTALLLSLVTAGLNAFGSIEATSTSPAVSMAETSHFAANFTCPAYHDVASASSWDCTRCLKASPSCGFCASPQNKIVNSEIYPLRLRGVCGGIAATANWISNLVVAQSFLPLTHAIGTSWTFLVFGVISVVALFFVLICVPETKGLPIEEIEKILERRG